MDQDSVQSLTLIIAAAVAASVAYGKVFGSLQTQVVQWVIDAFEVKSRWRGLLNLGVGLLLAVALSVLAALQAGDWSVVGVGVMGGLLASVEAAKAHDQSGDKIAPPAT